MRVAVIGLGSMGYGAAVSLLRAGFDVAGCDLADASRARFQAAGGTAHADPGRAAEGAAVAVLMVVNAAQTEAVLFGDPGASNPGPGAAGPGGSGQGGSGAGAAGPKGSGSSGAGPVGGFAAGPYTGAAAQAASGTAGTDAAGQAETHGTTGGGASAGGIAARLAPGAVVISSATMAPADARRLAQRAAAAGLLYLDAPISGGALRAEEGTITVMASGADAAFAAADPVLTAIAATVHRLGDAPGIGASFKIVNQLLAGVHIAAACEAVTLAARLGLDLPKVYEVITGSAGNSWMFQNRVPHILEGDYRPRSAVDIFTKDLGIVAAIGLAEKFPMPVAGTALQMFLATAAAGMGRDDDASVARLIAQTTGLTLPGTARE